MLATSWQHFLVSLTAAFPNDWNDRGTAVLFGDGAGAVVIEASDEPGILSTHIHAAGRHSDLLFADVGVGAGFRAEPRVACALK